MTKFLLKIFVPGDPGKDTKSRSAVGSLSGTVGIICNLILFLGKLAAGALTGSVSITADAMNNLSDASGSIVTVLGFRLARRPADDHHPYGHARYEYLTGLAVAAMILFIGFELAKSSAVKILKPTPVAYSSVALGILLASVAVKLWLWRFNAKLGRLISSAALAATAADSRNDCLATSAVLVAAAVEYTLNLRIDGFVGLAVAVFILYSGLQMARQTISPLLGESTSPELRERILDYVTRHPKVLGYHDLQVHDYGPGQRFATLHVEMDYREDPLDCHEIIDDLERECMRSHGIHLVIHYDPVITDDPELTRLKEQTQALLWQQDPELNLHDFRMVQGRRHMNLVFDVSLPRKLRGREEDLRSFVEEELNREGPMRYHVKITFDPVNFS